MTTSRIKEKISALVSSQLPEFIQSDFPTFVAFIEAYYRFLEQDQSASELIQNARSYNDIDTTTESFVQYFLDTYAKSIPRDILLNDRFLIKKVSDLYESKGSDLSFKLLFKTLFNTDVSVRVPYENVLRASGGNWQQNFSIRVETVSGNRNILSNRLIRHTVNGVTYNTPIVRTKILTSTLTELFLDGSSLSPSYSLNDLVEVYENSTLIFSGTISPTTVSFRIDQPGTGFKVGQIFNISAGGINTLIKVTEVSLTGGLVNFKIISYGYGYSGDSGTNILTVILDKDNNISFRENIYTSRTGGFGSSGLILKSDLSSPERYFLEDYTDDPFYTITAIAGSFNNDAFVSQITSEGGSITSNLAVIIFDLGALAKYPGSYFTDQSFLSEFEVRLQDDQLYQPFAYQTVTDVDITSFIDIVKKLLNPAGQVLFNNRTVAQDLDLSSSLTVENDRKININLHDFTTYTDFLVAEVNTFKDSVNTIDQDADYELQKPIDELVSIDDPISLSTSKEFSDSAQMTDLFEIGLFFTREFEENRSNDYFLESYDDLGDYAGRTGIVLSDVPVLSINKNIIDTSIAETSNASADVYIVDYFDYTYTNQKPILVGTQIQSVDIT